MTNQRTLELAQINARAKILETHRAEAIRLALRITGNPTAAEDIVQTAFLKILQAENLPNFLPELIRYSRRTVTNCAIDYLRQLRVKPPQPHIELKDPTADLQIRQTLAQLSPEHQVILALAIGEGYSYREISDYLDIPMGTVASRLNQARAAFKTIWEGTK